MFGFFKKKFTGAQIGQGFFLHLKEEHLAGHPEGKGVYPLDTGIGADLVKMEWLFFRAFIVDFTVYLALGQSKEKNAILDAFWDAMQDWLKSVSVPALPERCIIVGGPRTIPPEVAELCLTRLQRRITSYVDALKTPNRMGENWMVAGTFAGFCGDMDASVMVAVSTFFSFQKIQTVKMMKSIRIVAD